MGMSEMPTFILMVITAVYVLITWRILKANQAVVAAMRAEHTAAFRPYVTVATFTVPTDIQIYLRVENTGKTAARNVSLSLDRAFHRHARPDNNLQSYPAFSQPIESLAPGMRLTFTLGTSINLFGESAKPELTPLTFNVRAQYKWDGGSADETSSIDLRPYLQTNIEGDPLVNEIKRLREAVEKLR